MYTVGNRTLKTEKGQEIQVTFEDSTQFVPDYKKADYAYTLLVTIESGKMAGSQFLISFNPAGLVRLHQNTYEFPIGKLTARIAQRGENNMNMFFNTDGTLYMDVWNNSTLRKFTKLQAEYVSDVLSSIAKFFAEMNQDTLQAILIEESRKDEIQNKKDIELIEKLLVCLKTGQKHGFNDSRRVHDIARRFERMES